MVELCAGNPWRTLGGKEQSVVPRSRAPVVLTVMSVFFVFAVPVGPPHDGRGRSELDRVDCGVETTIRVNREREGEPT